MSIWWNGQSNGATIQSKVDILHWIKFIEMSWLVWWMDIGIGHYGMWWNAN